MQGIGTVTGPREGEGWKAREGAIQDRGRRELDAEEHEEGRRTAERRRGGRRGIRQHNSRRSLLELLDYAVNVGVLAANILLDIILPSASPFAAAEMGLTARRTTKGARGIPRGLSSIWAFPVEDEAISVFVGG